MRIYKRKQTIERITIIGPMAEWGEGIVWCHNNGYSITQSGAKPLRLGYISHAKFKIVAEREIR